MKFSITFKYSNITFKNKENKETVTYDSKADGNTFTFDNVDEDVVIGIVNGIKDKKASQVFSYDNLRTNFVNVIARNKCKELYDKLDKGGWKVEDVVISSATIKDLEFTKPTMNARENLTVESLQKPSMDESVEGIGQKMDFQQFADFINSEFKKKVLAKVDSNGTQVRLEVYPNEKKEIEEILNDICGQNGWKYEKVTRNLHYTYYVTYDSVNESKFTDNMHKKNSDDLYELNNAVHEAIREIGIISNMYDVSDTAFEKLQDVRMNLLNALPSTKTTVESGNNEYLQQSFRHLMKMCVKSNPQLWSDLADIYEKHFGQSVNESIPSYYHDDEPEYFGDGRLHVFYFGTDCPFAEDYIVLYPSGAALCTNESGSVSFWDEDEYSYSTQQEMEDNFAVEGDEGEECRPVELKMEEVPPKLMKLIKQAASSTGYDIDLDI